MSSTAQDKSNDMSWAIGCVFLIITFFFSLLITIYRYYMTMMTEISNAGGWIASDEWYDPGHIKRSVLGNWYVIVIIIFTMAGLMMQTCCEPQVHFFSIM